MEDEALADYRVHSVQRDYAVNEVGPHHAVGVGRDVAQITDVSDRNMAPAVCDALWVPVIASGSAVATTAVPFLVNVEAVRTLTHSHKSGDDSDSTFDLGKRDCTGRQVTDCGRHLGNRPTLCALWSTSSQTEEEKRRNHRTTHPLEHLAPPVKCHPHCKARGLRLVRGKVFLNLSGEDAGA